jgi:serine protease SohB
VLGEITEKGRAKFQEQLEETHGLFKDWVKSQRPKLDMAQVATGEYWLGTRALQLGLVDKLHTSDDYLLEKAKTANVFKVTFEPHSSWRERLSRGAAEAADRTVLTLLSRLLQLELR